MDLIDSLPSGIVTVGVQSKHGGSLRRMTTGYCAVSKEQRQCRCHSFLTEKSETTATISQSLEDLDDSPVNYCVPIQARFPTEAERRKDGRVQADSKVSECQCASMAVGTTIELLEAVFAGRLNNGFIIVRQSGDRFPEKEGCGFSSSNNVAVGARHLLEEFGVKKILIVDFGVHPEPDIGEIFYEDDRVLYFSIHDANENSKKSPQPKETILNQIGSGKGKGYNVNLPLQKQAAGDAEFLAIFLQVLLPMAFEYNPEMVILSARYDAAFGYPKASGNVTPAMYGHLIHSLKTLAAGKLAVILQEGFSSESISQSAACTIEALLGRPCPALPAVSRADTGAITAIVQVTRLLRSHWKCFKVFENETGDAGSVERDSVLKREIPSEIPVLAEKEKVFRKNLPEISTKFRTCLVYDSLMLGHDEGLDGLAGPEIPGRLTSIFGHLSKTALMEQCLMVEPRDVLSTELDLIHSKSYVKLLHLQPESFVQETEKRKLGKMKLRDRWPNDIWATEGTLPAIWRAAGSLLSVLDTVLTGKALNGYAIIRPPGHHAHLDSPAGFCFANNIAIAAKYAIQKYGLERILIVDWDVHHGDGTQEAFYEDPRVCYISLHRGEADFYPEGKKKGVKFTGSGKGQGYNINIPWQQPRMTDGDYVAAFLQLVMPIAYEFAPELVLVSCGFDAALGDPLGGCCVTEIGYAIMTRMVSGLADGRVILALEGGYNLQMLAKCSESVVRSLLGFQMQVISKPLVPSPTAALDIKRAIDAQLSVSQRSWQSLQSPAVLQDLIEDRADETSYRDVPVSVNSKTDHDTELLTLKLQKVLLE